MVSARHLQTLALSADGRVWAWGSNSEGQLGLGRSESVFPYAERVGTESDWTMVAASEIHSLGLKSDQSLWAWGEGGYYALGDGSSVDRDHPVPVTRSGWTTMTGTNYNTYAIAADGTLWGWGDDVTGFLFEQDEATGEYSDYWGSRSAEPVQMSRETDWVALSGGFDHCLAVRADGSLWAWGWNAEGQLGDGTTADSHTPVRVGTNNDWVAVAAGKAISVGLKRDGSIWAWGCNAHYGGASGNCSSGAENPTPTRLDSSTGYTAVAAGMSHGLALKSDGSLWGWGYDYYHQLGPYVPVSEMTPRQIGSETDWVAVDGGRTFTVAIKADGSVWAWGGQEYGVLGNGKEEFDFVIDPVRVMDSSGSPINLGASSDDGGDDGGGDASGVEAFVTRFYQQCLNREPDAGGLRTWSDALTSGSMTGADVAKAFILSPEFIARNLSDEDFVTVLYRAFFGREPDSGGYTAWLDRLAQGATREEAVDGFTHSAEFANLCGEYGITPY